jgi:hypothetical protein
MPVVVKLAMVRKIALYVSATLPRDLDRVMSPELKALQDADFGWVRTLDSVWSDEAADAGPNEDLVDGIISELAALTKSPNPPSRVLLGQAGIGKTHLVGHGLKVSLWHPGFLISLITAEPLSSISLSNGGMRFATSFKASVDFKARSCASPACVPAAQQLPAKVSARARAGSDEIPGSRLKHSL